MKKISVLASIVGSILLPGAVAAQEIMDVRSHDVLPEYIEALRAHGAELEEGFPLPAWTEEAHLAFMEETGIATTVLSMPAPQPYFGDSDECKKVVRQYNEACAALKAKHPGKFLFVAALPLPDVDAAIEEAAQQGMLVRIWEIEVYPQYLDEYLARAAKVGSTSVREEAGGIAIYPMVQNRDACQIRQMNTMLSGHAAG